MRPPDEHARRVAAVTTALDRLRHRVLLTPARDPRAQAMALATLAGLRQHVAQDPDEVERLLAEFRMHDFEAS